MRSRLRSFLLTSALSFIPSLASATTISGLYVDGGAGYNEVQDQHVHANSPAMSVGGMPVPGMALPKFSVNHGTGFTGFGAVGWGFGNGLRVEAEGLYNFSHDSYTDYANTNNTPYLNSNDKALMEKYFPGITVTPGHCSQVLKEWGGSVSKALAAWYPSIAGVSNYAFPTPQNIFDGNYIPDKCYTVVAQNSEDLNKALKEVSHLEGFAQPGMYNTTQYIKEGNSLYYGRDAIATRVPFSQVSHHGTDESYGGFANVIYDFDLERLFGVKSIVTPFIGGGAGYLWQRYNRPNTMIGAITGTHGGFAWQGIIGVAFDTGIRGLQITAQYRMIGQP
ncbi:MAG: hypothetical protein J6P19_02550, partial [Acetobacter sp.]|nr:hypothetical protein [Acetobacter sp.]